MLALIGGSQSALLYYAITYAVTSVGAFGVIAVMENRTGNEAIAGLAGLRERSFLLSAVLTVFMLSLAGIPPLAGFFGKFYVFIAAAKQGAGLGYWWLVAVALAASCVSLYYYLQVLKQVWVTPAGEGQGKVSGGIIVSALLVVLALVVVVTGCVPELLLRLLK
jgi:NADH-quinone oxidoreductase subunit N